VNGRPIVVGIDGSEAGAYALAWAAAEAERKGVELLVAHATDTVPRAALSRATVTTVLKECDEFGQQLLAEAARKVIDTHPGVQVTVVLRAENPVDLLTDLSRTALMLVVATHGDGQFTGALRGSVSQRVAAHAICPVVVIAQHGGGATEHRRVVVGVSGSPHGLHALRFAFQEAKDRDATLMAVRAYGVFGRSAHAQIFGALPGFRRSEDRILRESIATVSLEFPGVTVDPALVEEPPHDALPRLAADADLLVVGCHYDDTHWPSRLGPVASMLLHRSPCPIAIVGFDAAAILATV
jgi:nucleotide-binding universal stress UspA family protein